MTDKINPSIASSVADVIEERKSQKQMYCTNPVCGNEYPAGTVGPKNCAECGGLMEFREIEKEKGPLEGADDVMVNIGDMSGARVEDVNTQGDNFALIAEDYIVTFNRAVTMGMSPLKALLAIVQATAIITGWCLRCGMRPQIAYGMVKLLANKIDKESNRVQIATKPN